MRRIISIFLAIMILTSGTIAFADINSDIKKMNDKQLAELYEAVKEEMQSRGLALSSINLQTGKYIVGEDIEPGTYIFTCTGTEGEKLNDTYSSLGDAYGALMGDSSWGKLFGSLGDAMEDLSYATIEIIGDYGTVIKSVELDAGESVELTLSEKTAIQITDGSCSAELKA